ncbi:dynein regulation protein LC7 [Paractinoplanes abujensis]|uniref:Putative regulator of Ras-like GTPase activity (Roadblock/LC7/MglB family) n=1 Tax=Paractinoplanes abujensis TaxID=882441 RepID=A0A7W7G0R5_9ACTN|nr:roadblock/LC7 domain-containing protein [Actinoplanes abujensis]MBB4693353.1 putative regulator of Ras-like GTPase activity (Roadblock/LC7/MglB family) [Actinoplanes abujensis]GID24557.1 dynein regulation protein LC7 [Actinoplanes abujensis]
MSRTESPRTSQDLVWLLSSLVDRVPDTTSALLLSSDGLRKAAHGLDDDGADHLAAVASGLFSLARSAGTRFGGSDSVRQVVAELEEALLFVSAAGSGAVLAVVAGKGADPGVLGYEMAQLVKSVRPYLSTPARHDSEFLSVRGQ